MIDTHAHLTDKKFTDIDLIINNAKKNNVNIIINNTSNINDSFESLKIANDYTNIYSTFGIHPLDVSEDDISMLNENKDAFLSDKVVAFGEIGLDYHYSEENKVTQKKTFIHQLDINTDYNLPIVIHAREAISDTIDIISNYSHRGVFHCFSGNIPEVKKILDMGYYIGFDGPITFKKNEPFIELINYCPLDRILCETDSPYLAPVPFRGKTNEPANVKYVYEKIKEIKNISIEELISIIHNNTLSLFRKIKNSQ